MKKNMHKTIKKLTFNLLSGFFLLLLQPYLHSVVMMICLLKVITHLQEK